LDSGKENVLTKFMSKSKLQERASTVKGRTILTNWNHGPQSAG